MSDAGIRARRTVVVPLAFLNVFLAVPLLAVTLRAVYDTPKSSLDPRTERVVEQGKADPPGCVCVGRDAVTMCAGRKPTPIEITVDRRSDPTGEETETSPEVDIDTLRDVRDDLRPIADGLLVLVGSELERESERVALAETLHQLKDISRTLAARREFGSTQTGAVKDNAGPTTND